MSLVDVWDATQAGCVAIPQHGYVGDEPPASMRIIWSKNGSRHSIAYLEPVTVRFQNTSPPQRMVMIVNEKNPPLTGYDPQFRIDAFLGVCGTRGFGLGTPRWFGAVSWTISVGSRIGLVVDWVHVCYYHTNEGSFGVCEYNASPP